MAGRAWPTRRNKKILQHRKTQQAKMLDCVQHLLENPDKPQHLYQIFDVIGVTLSHEYRHISSSLSLTHIAVTVTSVNQRLKTVTTTDTKRWQRRKMEQKQYSEKCGTSLGMWFHLHWLLLSLWQRQQIPLQSRIRIRRSRPRARAHFVTFGSFSLSTLTNITERYYVFYFYYSAFSRLSYAKKKKKQIAVYIQGVMMRLPSPFCLIGFDDVW